MKTIASTSPSTGLTTRLSTRAKISAVLLFALAVLAACGPTVAPTPALTRITVQLRWTHEAQFGGFYAADQNGYYSAEGLAVTFVQGGPVIDLLTPVLDGTAQFGVAGADELILARAAGKPLRAIATTYRRSPIVFFALADSGITRPQDFVGKTIRVVPGQAPTFHAMMARVGISPDQYTEVVLPSDLALFAAGEADVWTAYLTSMVVTVQRAGYKLNIVFPDDYGVHFYADTIFAADDLIATNPGLVLRFLRATLKGWRYAIEDPAVIGPMVARSRPDADVELETAKMTASLPLVHTGEDHIGWMRAEVWQGMHDILLEQGILAGPVDVDKVYTMEFLQTIYGGE